MRKRLVNFATAMSLLLLAGTIALWVRSREIDDCIGYRTALSPGRPWQEFRLWSRNRTFGGDWLHRWPVNKNASMPGSLFSQINWNFLKQAQLTDVTRYMLDPRQYGSHFGVSAGSYRYPSSPDVDGKIYYSSGRWFAARYSTLIAAFSLIPLCKGISIFRTRRFGTGMCAQCGYDLRATPDRCPECGAAAAKATAM